MTADEIIKKLGMQAHPEGGWYVELWRGAGKERAAYSSIYFLLQAGEKSRWHRVDADEIWHFHAGAPLALRRSLSETGPAETLLLGSDILAGQKPQHRIPAGHWQAAESLGDWTLVGCVVAPGFQFDGFELAPEDFDIPT